MQLFQVKSMSGHLIMNAPLETLRWVFKLPVETTAQILHGTVSLSASVEVRVSMKSQWTKVLIERLPMEIPATETGRETEQMAAIRRAHEDHALGQRLAVNRDAARDDLAARRQLHSQTILGELLCDE